MQKAWELTFYSVLNRLGFPSGSGFFIIPSLPDKSCLILVILSAITVIVVVTRFRHSRERIEDDPAHGRLNFAQQLNGAAHGIPWRFPRLDHQTNRLNAIQ